MSKNRSLTIIPIQKIVSKIYWIRGRKVMIDSDLAALYSVLTGTLIQAVKRNKGRFPADFMFQLNAKEHASLISQIVISKGRGGRRFPPYVERYRLPNRKVPSTKGTGWSSFRRPT